MLTVEKLIEILSKIENKNIPVEFSYHSRTAGRIINCIDLVDSGEALVFRSEAYDEYCYMNPNYLGETKEAAVNRITKEATEFYEKYLMEYGISDIKDKIQRDVKLWEFHKQETEDHVNLYIEEKE